MDREGDLTMIFERTYVYNIMTSPQTRAGKGRFPAQRGDVAHLSASPRRPVGAIHRIADRGRGEALFRLRDRESGSALLIVLAFIVILAVVLVAFLSNSQRALQQSESSATILTTQMLGQVATAAIIDDLRDEMESGADEVPQDGEAMEVSQPWAMVPGRVVKEPAMLSNPVFVNLVKQSVNGQAFYPGNSPATYTRTAKTRASAVSTLTPSRNQRLISAARWDKPKLVGGASGLVNFTNNQVPDWILITRAGAAESGAGAGNMADKDPENANYVLGRFAYNIYQVGGLLDINVAGFDPNGPNSAEGAASKGSLAWADLRAIPGLDTDASVKAIVEWRNKLTKSNYPAMIAGLAPGAPPNTKPGRWGEPGGFLESYSDGTQTDNRFFSRQDLLNYFEHAFGPGSDQAKAFPFLTTFSADLDQPSFRPDPDRPKVQRAANLGGNDAFGDETKTESQQINPPLLSVLGSDGAPVIKRRFPLDRLKYVTSRPSEPAKVAEYFGLTWNDIEQAWNYVDGDSIKRLHEIQGREPNMVELLKAAIATGSLGGQLNYGEERAGMLQNRDSSINYHIMRIAASLIDQYDSDSYPTRIRFGSYVVCGVENLPYLYGLRTISYRQNEIHKTNDVDPAKPVPASATGPLHRHVVMIQPIIWNPHAPAEGVTEPLHFRVTARSGLNAQPAARRAWWVTSATGFRSDWPAKKDTTGNPIDPRDRNEPVSFSPNVDFITFDGADAFREPYPLRSPLYPPGSNTRAFGTLGEFSEPVLPQEQDSDMSTVIGFRVGWAWGGPWQSGAIGGNATWLQEGRVSSNGIDFELQYQSPSGNWITYDAYEGFGNSEVFRLDRLNSGAASVNPRSIRFYVRTDPRVDRYGARAPLQLPSVAQGASFRPGQDGGVIAQTGWPDEPSAFNFNVPASNAQRFLGLMSENKPGSVLSYEDPDGVQRIAMGGYSEGLNGLPMATAAGNYASRPVVLNRPFRSVAELSYVLRDQPWKQLDFFSPQSGDTALLDVFCLYEAENPEGEPVVAGRVNLNTGRPEVVEALLRGVELREGSSLSNAQANSLAEALVNWTASSSAGKGPLRNRGEVVGKFVTGKTFSGFSSTLTDVLSGADEAIPLRRQNALRGLADAGTTRTWNFLIDLIVQDGQFAGTSTAPQDFVVRGEKRYWVHVAMDRFTGQIIAERMEEVHE